MGLGGLMKSVAREVGSRGITANVVAPGYVGADGEDLSPYVALARPGGMEDIACTIAFVAGDTSGYITGQMLRVDGGLDTA
jgi:3-oxoacyl-[acyl-carrier protein] reductase